MSFIKVIGAPIVDFNEGDKIEDVIAKIVANEKNLYLQMIEICKFLDAVYATDGDMKADFSATLNIGSIVNVTVKYNKLFIKYKTDDGKEDVIVYQLHVSESDEGSTPVQLEEKSIIIIPVLWGTLDDLPQRPGAPGMLWHLGDYWYDTENKVLKVCTNDTIYEYEFEEVQFEQGKEYLIINKYGEEIYCYDRIREELKIVANYGASEEEKENKVLIAHATNPHLAVDGKTLYDCDVDIVDAFDFIAANGYIVVEGSMIGNRKLLLTNVVEIDGTYYIVGIVSSAGKLYDVSLSNPVNTAASTLTVSEIKLNAGVADLDRRVTTLENTLSELEYNYNVTAQDLANYKTIVNSYLATIQSNTNRIVNLESRCTSLSSAIQTNLNSINGLANRITALEQNNRTIDKQLDRNSTNPVENKAIANAFTEDRNRLAALEQRDPAQITIDDELNRHSTNPVENKAIVLEIDRLEDLIEDIEPEVDTYDYSSDPRYPEYHSYAGGAKGDGINYYDWPLACFNGFMNDEITIEETTANVEVYAPSERIMDKYGLTTDYKGKSLAYCSDSVYYNSPTNKFVLRVNGHHYDKWLNSDVYNDVVTGKARTDVVFSDISEVPLSSKQSYGLITSGDKILGATYKDTGDARAVAQRRSYIFDNTLEEPNLVDIFDTMTDDGPALRAWFDANNGSEMRLRPGAIYYFRSVDEGKPLAYYPTSGANKTDYPVEPVMFDVFSNTTIIGNGAVLFPHRIDPGWPCLRTGNNVSEIGGVVTIFKMKQLTTMENVKFSDFSINTLRDKDSNAADGINTRFSTSDSWIRAFYADNATVVNNVVTPYATPNHIYIDKVNSKNLRGYLETADHRSNSTYMCNNFYVSNAICTGMLGTVLSLKDSVYDNMYMETAPLIGHDGTHLFYFDCNNNNLVIKNSKLKAVDPYRETFITFHSSSPRGEVCDLYYENCEISATGPIFGDTDNVAGKVTVHFKGCIITKTFEIQCGTSSAINDAKYLFNTEFKKWEFINCTINTGYGQLCNGGNYQLTFKNVHINSDIDSYTRIALCGFDYTTPVYARGYVGDVIVENLTHNYPGPLGFYVDYESLTDDSVELKRVKQLLVGREDVIFRDNPIWSPKVGDIYFDTTLLKLRRCTAVGSHSAVSVSINMDLTGAPYTGTQVITFNDKEKITFVFDNVTTVDGIRDVVERALVEAGYSSTYATRRRGEYAYGVSSSNHIMTVHSKQDGALLLDSNGNLSTTMSNLNNSPLKYVRGTGSDWYKSLQGVNPTWEDLEVGGLVEIITELDSRVDALEG